MSGDHDRRTQGGEEKVLVRGGGGGGNKKIPCGGGGVSLMGVFFYVGSLFFFFFFNRRILLHGKNSQKRDNIIYNLSTWGPFFPCGEALLSFPPITIFAGASLDWLALHLKVGSGIDYFWKL